MSYAVEALCNEAILYVTVVETHMEAELVAAKCEEAYRFFQPLQVTITPEERHELR